METGDEKRMKQFTYVVTDEIGIHARPAGLLVKEAKQFQSTVMLTCKGKSAAATKLMAVMGMGVKHGDSVEVSVEGPDEDAAYEAMERFSGSICKPESGESYERVENGEIYWKIRI